MTKFSSASEYKPLTSTCMGIHVAVLWRVMPPFSPQLLFEHTGTVLLSDVAPLALSRCVHFGPENANPNNTDTYIEFNYDFVDDMHTDYARIRSFPHTEKLEGVFSDLTCGLLVHVVIVVCFSMSSLCCKI